MLGPSAITPDRQLEQFFAALVEGYDRACQAAGSRRLHLTIAERGVHLTIAGEGLIPLTRPLAHLITAPGLATPALEICAWESPPGWSPPPPFWKQGQQGYQGEILGLGSGRFQVNYHDTSGLFNMFDRQTRKALYWIPYAASLPFWEIASPLRIVFYWWARLLGGHMAHAAVVGQDSRGVLLAGKSGSGKSTASLACLFHGMEFVGDDYVLLTNDPTPMAHSLYSSAKMHTDFLGKALPDWKSLVAQEIGPEHKSVFYLQESQPANLRSRLELCALVIPHVGTQASATLVSRPAAEGLMALAPSTLLQFPEARREAMAFLSTLLRRLPVWALHTGTDLAATPQALCELLASLQPRCPEVHHG